MDLAAILTVFNMVNVWTIYKTMHASICWVYLNWHGHYNDACVLFFPPNAVPPPPQPSILGGSSNFIFIPSKARSIGYRLWDNRWFVWIVYWLWCNVCYWKHLFSTRMSSAIPRDVAVNQYTAAALVRIWIYCETHKHFNYLYKFQVIFRPNILILNWIYY